MKKNSKILLTSLFVIALLVFKVASPINAVGQNQNRVQDPTTHDGDVAATQEQQMLQDGTGAGQGTIGGTRAGIDNATENLNRVANRINNPDVGEQLRVMTENHAEMQAKIQTAMQNINARSRALKFIFGPSYQNAGDVKKFAAQLRSDAGELAAIKDELTSTTDQEEIQSAIDELETEADALETELAGTLRGFSLFGWLNRILSGY